MATKFTISDFNEQFPNDSVCLETVFWNRYGEIEFCPGCGVISPKFYRIKKRKCYSCKDCGYQLHPLADTIFHKSETPLTKWFYAIYLFSVSRNGVSGKELERQLGVTYKTAWRIGHQIRKLMEQNRSVLSGTVEADETFIGGRQKGNKNKWRNKTAVLGAVERKGKAQAIVAEANVTAATPFIETTVSPDSRLMTDESPIYTNVGRNYIHQVIRHAKKSYVEGEVHTNTIEGFWSQLKRSLDGTHHAVSPKYLQKYVDEYAFRYNLRDVLIYPVLMSQAVKPVRSTD